MSEDYFKYHDNFAKYKEIESIKIDKNNIRKDTLFTIAIPTFKRQEILKKALDSAINQININDYEIIIVDNDCDGNPTDEIIDICNKNSIVNYYKNEVNIGMFGNWNRCIELSHGKYITILNDDDWLSEDFLSICKSRLRNDIDGLYFITNVADYRSNELRRDKYRFLKAILNAVSKNEKRLTLFDFFLGNKSGGSLGLLFKTDYLKELGGYNENYFPSCDYILHANYCNKYRVFRINIKLNFYRIQENESCKQETLKRWESLDNDIREYFIDIMGKRKLLIHLNTLLQEDRIYGMVKCWNYQTEYKFKHKIQRMIISKLVAVKYVLNI